MLDVARIYLTHRKPAGDAACPANRSASPSSRVGQRSVCHHRVFCRWRMRHQKAPITSTHAATNRNIGSDVQASVLELRMPHRRRLRTLQNRSCPSRLDVAGYLTQGTPSLVTWAFCVCDAGRFVMSQLAPSGFPPGGPVQIHRRVSRPGSRLPLSPCKAKRRMSSS